MPSPLLWRALTDLQFICAFFALECRQPWLRDEKAHILFQINFLAPTQPPPRFGPPEKSLCASFPGKERKKGTHINFFGGIFGVENGVPNGPFLATKKSSLSVFSCPYWVVVLTQGPSGRAKQEEQERERPEKVDFQEGAHQTPPFLGNSVYELARIQHGILDAHARSQPLVKRKVKAVNGKAHESEVAQQNALEEASAILAAARAEACKELVRVQRRTKSASKRNTPENAET